MLKAKFFNVNGFIWFGFINNVFMRIIMGQDSSVGIATRYILEGPGIESRWGRDFPHTSRPALPPPSYTMGTEFLSWSKIVGTWR
jgi:hypothetical protein